jgi:hypothetical protein
MSWMTVICIHYGVHRRLLLVTILRERNSLHSFSLGFLTKIHNMILQEERNKNNLMICVKYKFIHSFYLKFHKSGEAKAIGYRTSHM